VTAPCRPPPTKRETLEHLQLHAVSQRGGLPGGQINPDLGVQDKALQLVKDVFNQKKIVTAVRLAPWLLIETSIANGRKLISCQSIKTDMTNPGAKREDSELVVDKGVVTFRNPGDLEAFSAKIIEDVREGGHAQRSAA
jgi:protease I